MTKNISIRLAVVDGDKARKELNLTGEVGERAMRRIREATKPASKSLAAINVVSEQTNFLLMHLANGSGALGISLSRLGPLGLIAAAGIGALSTAVGHGLKEFKEAEQALNHLNMALKATDLTSGMTATKISELGEALEGTTLFKKEAIENAAASLTSFGRVQGKVFEKALKLSADLAVRLGTDVPSAADVLGRALENPEAGLGRLSRKFSDLSFAQKESIENFLKQGDVMSAQMIIIDHLESKIKGLAEAQTKGLTGATNMLAKAFDNLFESLWKVTTQTQVVQSTMSGLTSGANTLRKAIDPTFLERKEVLEKEIAGAKSGKVPKYLDTVAFGGSQGLKHKQAELEAVNEKIAQQQKQQDEEQARSVTAATEAAFKMRNDKLLELQRKYMKERTELTTSPQQKILTDHSERSQEISALGRGGASDELMQKALGGLDQSTTLKLASTPGVPHDGAQTQEYYEAQKKALDDWRANLERNIDGAKTKNDEYLAQVEQIYNARLKEIYKQSIADSTDWSDGAQRALMSYSESAMNAATNAEKVFGAAANKAEDVLTNAVMKGKLSFDSLKSFALSTLEDIARAMIRQNITGPLASGLGSMMGGFGIFHGGGVVGTTPVPMRYMPAYSPGYNPSDFLSHIPRLHSGLAPDEFPAILQRGETVLPKNTHHKDYKNHNINITFNVTTPDAQSFMESRGQIMASLAGEIDRFRKRNL